MFSAFALDSQKSQANKKTNKQKKKIIIISTSEEFLEACIKPKRTAYILFASTSKYF